jgi:LPS export ABC transporter protein LptC
LRVPGAPGAERLRAARRVLLSVAVAGTVVVIGLVAERASRLGDTGSGPSFAFEADLSLAGLELEQVGQQGLEVRLTAEEAHVVDVNRELVAHGIQAAFFQDGQPAVRLVADDGRMALDGGTVRVSGRVDPARLTLADGTRFTAPALVWDPQTQTVRSEGGASVAGPGFTGRGAEAVADARRQTVEMSGDVHVRWGP